ncbi:Xaa-Pro dipeptidase [Halomonas daqiaonensis]|uniref:Xaa-Pro dipeptidase n=1 Tax=Halomonas daqiaonensis TaxID=650850 RepID=A0A1H7FEK6_9GAMM|nr:Xaa-Pro dipeptidase [Halomonas daqiaonensis]SEK24418.1 Xaa-Pro dipeptidase [Halomonas daqiaonensis]
MTGTVTTSALASLQRNHLAALQQAYDEMLTRLGLDGVLLYSGHPRRHFADDQEASFAAYGHFMHWTGQVDLVRSWLLIRPGKRPRFKVHAPDDFWHLPASLPDEAWVTTFDIEMSRDDAPPTLPAGRFAVLGDVSTSLAEALGVDCNPAPLVGALDEGRVRKSDYEIACLHSANQQAMAGHRAARRAFLEGGAELDIQLAYLGASRQRETALPYASIVGVNAHGGVLHYQHYDTFPPARRRSLLLDAGHRHRGYCADITRTWAGPGADTAFASLIEGVTAMQQRLIEALAPGVDYVDLHQWMHLALGELLAEQDMVHCTPEAAVAQGITRAFCPHGLGHSLGLQVHDVAGRVDGAGRPLPPPERDPALRLTRKLEAGMVVTMEPGLYVIPMLLAPLKEGTAGRDIDWRLVERLADHGGIRIEDNVVITPTGYDNLTPPE